MDLMNTEYFYAVQIDKAGCLIQNLLEK